MTEVSITPGNVFIVGGLPTTTYNPRQDKQLEVSLRQLVASGNKLISITWPTKSGKTVLCRKLFPEPQGMYLEGWLMTREEEFWTSMLHKLKSQSKDQESQSSTHTVEDAIENTAGVDFGPKIETKSASKETKSTTATETAKVFMNEKLLALEGLKSSAKLLIIDDFHYIEPDLQKVIVRSLKAAIFEGAKVIVLSVPHRSEDIPRQESEMTGRVSKLAVPIWSADELKEIARLGFKALNLLASDALLDRMTQESYGSPQLMQEFCLKICEHNGILAKKDFSFMLVEPNYDTFFKKSAEELASKVAFEKLSRGPRQRTDRLQRKLQEQDREVDLYWAVLIAIASTWPKVSITYEELRSALRKTLQILPASNEVTRVITEMVKIAKSMEWEPVLDWDKDNNTLYISDPFFAFYLKWMVAT